VSFRLDRDELIWPAQDGGYLAPPTNKSWMAGAVARYQKADKAFPRITAHALWHTAASLPISGGREREGGSADPGARFGGHDSRRFADLFERLHRSCRQVI